MYKIKSLLPELYYNEKNARFQTENMIISQTQRNKNYKIYNLEINYKIYNLE